MRTTNSYPSIISGGSQPNSGEIVIPIATLDDSSRPNSGEIVIPIATLDDSSRPNSGEIVIPIAIIIGGGGTGGGNETVDDGGTGGGAVADVSVAGGGGGGIRARAAAGDGGGTGGGSETVDDGGTGGGAAADVGAVAAAGIRARAAAGDGGETGDDGGTDGGAADVGVVAAAAAAAGFRASAAAGDGGGGGGGGFTARAAARFRSSCWTEAIVDSVVSPFHLLSGGWVEAFIGDVGDSPHANINGRWYKMLEITSHDTKQQLDDKYGHDIITGRGRKKKDGKTELSKLFVSIGLTVGLGGMAAHALAENLVYHSKEATVMEDVAKSGLVLGLVGCISSLAMKDKHKKASQILFKFGSSFMVAAAMSTVSFLFPKNLIAIPILGAGIGITFLMI